MQLFPSYKTNVRQLLAELALAYYQKEKFEDSITFFEKALVESGPGITHEGEIYYYLTACAHALGDRDRAGTYIALAKEKKLDPFAYQFILAENEFLFGDLEKALSGFLQADEKQPSPTLKQIILITRARLAYQQDHTIDPTFSQYDAYSFDPVYRNYVKLLQARHFLESQDHDKVLSIQADATSSTLAFIEFRFVQLRAAIEQLKNFDECKKQLEKLLHDYAGKQLLQNYLDEITTRSDKLSSNTIVFIYFSRLCLQHDFQQEDYDRLEKCIADGFKNTSDVYPEKFAMRLKAEMLESNDRKTEAAEAFFEAGKKYYFEGAPGDEFGQPLFERCYMLHAFPVENYWYYADAAYINSFNKNLAGPDTNALETAERIWKQGFALKPPDADNAWAYITRAYIEERKQYLSRQWNNELKYRSLFYTGAAICFEPDKPEWSTLAARYCIDIGLKNNAFALANQVYQNNPSDFEALEQITVATLDAGDVKKGAEYLPLLHGGKSHNTSLYNSWQAFILFHEEKFREGIAILEECLKQEGSKDDLWSHFNLMLFYWLLDDKSKAAGMATWIKQIDGGAYYPFTENEQATVLMMENQFDLAIQRISPVLRNPTFEPYASSLLLAIALQQGNMAQHVEMKNWHLAQRLSHPEIQISTWLSARGGELGKKFHPTKAAEIDDWLQHPETGFLQQLQKKKADTPGKASDKIEDLQEEIRYQLDYNPQCASNTWGSVAVLFYRAMYHFKQAELDLSLSSLEMISGSNRDFLKEHPEVKDVLDCCYEEIKRVHQESLNIIKSDEVDPALEENEKGNALNDEGKYAEALVHYKKAIELDPNEAAYYRNVGLMYNSLEQWEASFEGYSKSLQLEPENAYALNYAGNALFRQGKYEEAIPFYIQAIALENDNKTYYENLALTYARLGQQDKAAEYYEQLLKLEPGDDYVMNELANLKFLRGDIPGARALYEEAIKVKPTYSIYHYNLGRTYYQEKEYDLAKKHFLKAIELDPNNDFAYNFLGNTEMEHTQDYEKAIAFYEKAKAIKPVEAFYTSNLGLALYYQGKMEEAESLFNESLKLNENLADGLNGIGLVHYAREDYAAAAKAFNKAACMAPDNQTFSANIDAALSFLNENERKQLLEEMA